jgi:hypothetical protein
MAKMTTPKPFINIIWTCQEMMVWMSMEMLGSVDVILMIWLITQSTEPARSTQMHDGFANNQTNTSLINHRNR